MAKRPNYSQDRMLRERAQQLKAREKAERRAEKTAERHSSSAAEESGHKVEKDAN